MVDKGLLTLTLLFISKSLHISIKESAEQPNIPRQLTDRGPFKKYVRSISMDFLPPREHMG